MWDKDNITEETPIPVKVDGFPLVTTGRIVKSGNNPFVVAQTPKGTVEGRFSWDAIAQALNEKGVRLPLPNHCPPPATPGIRFLFPDCPRLVENRSPEVCKTREAAHMATLTTTPGIATRNRLLEAAKLCGIPFTLNRWGEGQFADGVQVTYDPADSETDPANAPSEFLYIKKAGQTLAEGVVNLHNDPNDVRTVYRPEGIDGPEYLLPSPEILVGMMLARLVRVLHHRPK